MTETEQEKENHLLSKGWLKTAHGWQMTGAHVRIGGAHVTFEKAVQVQKKLDSWWEEARR